MPLIGPVRVLVKRSEPFGRQSDDAEIESISLNRLATASQSPSSAGFEFDSQSDPRVLTPLDETVPTSRFGGDVSGVRPMVRVWQQTFLDSSFAISAT